MGAANVMHMVGIDADGLPGCLPHFPLHEHSPIVIYDCRRAAVEVHGGAINDKDKDCSIDRLLSRHAVIKTTHSKQI